MTEKPGTSGSGFPRRLSGAEMDARARCVMRAYEALWASGVPHPTIDQLAEKAGMSERHAATYRLRAVSLGWLLPEQVRRPRRRKKADV